jgi:L,D-transpeptidase catalytic domain
VKLNLTDPGNAMLPRYLKLALVASLAFAGAGGVETAFARPKGETGKKQKADEPPAPAGPLFFVISTSKQHVSVYGRNGLYARSPVSTGRPDHPTPLGLFTIIGKERYHHSNIYSGAPMPFMQRITWSGVAMHEGVLPGYAASHGCIRMPHDFARRLFSYTEGNEHVVIARQDVVPASISHPRLPVPKLMPMPGSDTIVSSSAQMLQNAIAAVSPPGPAGNAAKVDVAVKPGTPEAQPDNAAQKLLNPQEFAKAMKARAAKQAEQAGSALSPARGVIEAKVRELREATIGLRKAEVALAHAKDRVETADKQLQKAQGDDEAVKAAVAAKADAESKAAEAETALASAQRIKAEKEQQAATAQRAYREVESTKRAAADAIKSWTRRLSPISVFVSRKTQRLYVRQGFVKVFDLPITIREPEKPLGTHLFIAMPPEQNAAGESAALRWMALSIPETAADSGGESRKRRRRSDEDDAPRASSPAVSASEALDRIELPAEVEGKISEMLWAGGSLLVSDKGMSGETGDHTDFVILTR